MEYTDDFLKKIMQCGLLNYPASKIINIFDIEDEEQFLNDFKNPSSLLAKHYQKGVDRADFSIDSKLFDAASKGDLKALKELNERKNKRALKESELDMEKLFKSSNHSGSGHTCRPE
jgi:hypothetical protein